jgi:hypothetical protein
MSSVTGPTPAPAAGRGGVRRAPVLTVTARLLPLWLAWFVVVVVGRSICRLAQHLPPVVRLVRRLRVLDGGPVQGEVLIEPPNRGRSPTG